MGHRVPGAPKETPVRRRGAARRHPWHSDRSAGDAEPLMIRFVERKWIYFVISGLTIVPGVIFLLLGGLRPGIEFRGGTLIDVRFDAAPSVAEVREVMSGLGRQEAQIIVAEGGRVEIRTFEMTAAEQAATQTALEAKYGDIAVRMDVV